MLQVRLFNFEQEFKPALKESFEDHVDSLSHVIDSVSVGSGSTPSDIRAILHQVRGQLTVLVQRSEEATSDSDRVEWTTVDAPLTLRNILAYLDGWENGTTRI